MPKIDLFGSVANKCVILAVIFALMDTDETTGVVIVFFRISRVLFIADNSEIINPIVRPVAVDVVNKSIRMSPIMQCPYNAMHNVGFTHQPSEKILTIINGSCFFTGIVAIEINVSRFRFEVSLRPVFP